MGQTQKWQHLPHSGQNLVTWTHCLAKAAGKRHLAGAHPWFDQNQADHGHDSNTAARAPAHQGLSGGPPLAPGLG